MKIQVINEVRIPTLHPTDARSDKYYGVIYKYGGDKGFISALEYKDKFTIFCATSLTEGNCFGGFENCTNLQKLCEQAQDNFTIFQFDTYKELFKWLAED